MKKSARQLAYEGLYKVNYEKAYSNIVLNKLFHQYEVNYLERGFITELVYGTLSRLLYLNRIISIYSDIRINKLSKKVVTALQMGIFQLIFMDGVTDFAAVDETVRLIKGLDFRSTGFVNAVMRKIARDCNEGIKDVARLSEISDQKQYLSVKYSVSEYIIGRFLKMYGKEFTEDLLASFYEKPPLFIRANALKIEPQELKRKLSEEGIVLKETKMEGMFAAEGLRGVGSNPSFREGLFSIQDLSSARAVCSLDPKPGENVLDICSAPGGKSFYMAERMENKGKIDAMDVSANKLALLADRAEQLGIRIIRSEVSDARVFRRELEECYDKVLVDAPCSGFGIIRRKPELRYKDYEAVKELPVIQREILDHAARYLKRGGYLLYSTCTLEKKENIDVITDFLEKNPNFEPVGEAKEFYPHIDEGDGFFIAKMKKC